MQNIMSDMPPAAVKQAKLTKGYLEMLSASLGRGTYGVTVKEAAEGLWTVQLKFDGQQEERPVTTARGEMKVWRNLVAAITFVQANCALANTVFIEVGDWKLGRLENIN